MKGHVVDARVIDEQVEAVTYDEAKDARTAIAKAIQTRVRQSVKRRTPFLTNDVTTELAEDVAENVFAYLKGLFDL